MLPFTLISYDTQPQESQDSEAMHCQGVGDEHSASRECGLLQGDTDTRPGARGPRW